MMSKAVKITTIAGWMLAAPMIVTPMIAGMTLAMATPADAAQRVMVPRNHMVRITLPSAAGSVIVGNPAIADVNVVDSHTIFLIGRGYGSSAVTVVDRLGHTIYDGEVVVTTGAQGAVNVYKGEKASMMVCSNICTTVDDGQSSGGNGGSAAGSAPMATVSMPMSGPLQMPAAAPPAAVASGAAEARTQ